jgi:Putative phage tail protein
MAIFTGIAAAFSAVSTFIGGLGAIGSFLLKTAVGIGMNLLAQSLAGKQTGNQNFAINTTMQGGGDVPRSFIFGRYATAGSLVWVNTWGNDGDTPNAYLTQVIALSDIPVAGLNAVYVNSELVELGADTACGKVAVGEYADNLWVKFYDGTQTESDDFLVNTASNAQRQWNANRVGKGVAYAIITARVSKNKFSGIPSFKFVIDGVKLYDISKDSTAGGVGSHRWSDRSTWGGDGDHLPMVQAYNLLRGITYNGEWIYGLQNLPAARLPAADWIAKINKCRAPILGADGNEPTYRSAGEIQVDAPISTALEALLTTCQGKIAEVGGVYYPICGAPDDATISFTDGDILSTEEQEFTPFFGLSDTINGVSATYPSPADGWVTKTAPPLYRSDLETLDGGRRLMADVSLDFVPYAEQVQRLMKWALEEARRFRRHTIVLPPRFWAYAVPGAVFEWTSERNGYETKLMRIDGVADRANLDVMIDITEVDPADYDWSSEDEFQPPVIGSVGVIRPAPQPIVDWFAEGYVLKDSADNDRRPAIRLAWDNTASRLDDVVAVEYEVRLQETLAKVTEGRTDQPSAGQIIVSQSILPNEQYQARGRYIPGGDRETEWSDWLSVTTPNVLIGDVDVYLPGLLEEVNQAIEDSANFLGAEIDAVRAAQLTDAADLVAEKAERAAEIQAEAEERVADALLLALNYRDIRDTIDEIDRLVREQTFLTYEQSQQLRQTLNQRLSNSEATFDERITVAVSQTAAVAQRTTLLEATSGSLNAEIARIELAFSSADEAIAQQLVLLSVGTDNQFDHVSIWHFNSGIEGWGGNGTPSVSGGFLRPANQASDPYVVSPADLDVDAVKYSQVRGRIRKFGTTSWEGFIWWKGASDTTWDAARRLAITEPAYDEAGIALFTANMPWTGAISQLRIDLSAAADATNYFTVDWVAIGRPSPGASTAELLEERTARISSDAALSELVTNLDAELTGVRSGLTGLSSTVDALSASVTEIDGNFTALSTAVTGVQAALDGKASIEVVDSLSAQVAALDGGDIVSQGESIRAIRDQMDLSGASGLERGFEDFLRSMQIRKAVAEASNQLSTRIELTDESVTIISRDVSLLKAALPGLASASALQATEARVTAAEGVNSSQATSIASLATDLANKASSTALSSLGTRVDETESKITSINNDFTSLVTTVNNKVSTSAFALLQTRVEDTENAITVINDDITLLQGSLGGKASTEALSSLTTRLNTAESTLNGKNQTFRQASPPTPVAPGDFWIDTDDKNKWYRWSGSLSSGAWLVVQDGNIPELVSITTSQAQQLTSLNTMVGRFSANALFRVFSESTSGSALARIGMGVAASSGANSASAALYMEAVAGGESLLLLDADKVIMTNGAARKAPFIFTGGKLYLTDVNIENADIGKLTVGTSNIEPQAVSKQASFSEPGRIEVAKYEWTVVCDVTLNHGANSPPVLLFASLSGASDNGFYALRWRDRTANVIILDEQEVVRRNGQGWGGSMVHQPPSSRTSTRYQIEAIGFDDGDSSGAQNRNLVALALVR